MNEGIKSTHQNLDVFRLGMILQNIDNFDTTTFKGRLTLQKTIYLLQVFGLYIGYNFSWYLRGPYCSRLARNGFELENIYENIHQGSFEKKSSQKRFQEFLKFMANKKNEPDRIEILASIHFLKKIHTDMKKSEILNKVKKKQLNFTKKQCEDAWSELKMEKLI